MRRFLSAFAALTIVGLAAASPGPSPVKVLIITGDDVGAHDWKATTQALRDLLSAQGRADVQATTAPAKDLTDENLARYDVLLLNYRETPQGKAETKWSDANKAAFLKAVKDGKGLVVTHFASSSFTKPNWDEFEKVVERRWADLRASTV